MSMTTKLYEFWKTATCATTWENIRISLYLNGALHNPPISFRPTICFQCYPLKWFYVCLIYYLKKFHKTWTCCFSAVTTQNRPGTKLNQKNLFGLKTTRTTPKHCLQAPVGRSPALSSSLPSSKSCWQTSMSRVTHVVKQLHMQSSRCHCHFA